LVEPLLQAENLSKVYETGPERTVALADVSLRVEKGGFVAVLGPSGSGKTTLLSLLGGLDRPTTGRVYLDGLDISALDEKRLSQIRRRRVGMVFQTYNLADELTVVENVELPLLFEGKPSSEMRKRALSLLGQVGLSHKAGRRPFQLSSGEQQRAAVARALANQPSLVLMDEPTGNLDQENSDVLMSLVKTMNLEKGVALVIATHNMNIAGQALSQVILKSGRIASVHSN